MPTTNIKPAILLGNGLNNVNNSYTWPNLIDDLILRADLKGKIIPRDKPFPLLYEEIYAKTIKYRSIKENDLKKFISDKTTKIELNDLHKRIVNLGIKDFLTTNYDSVLENVLASKSIENISLIKELNYSIFRCKKLNQHKICHIHGEEKSPSSITLGYEHYSGYLQRMRNYVVAGLDYSKQSFESLVKRLTIGKIDEYSWLDLFFTRDIFIVGLSLDFIEMHLWWLLTYRSRLIDKKKISLKNRIIYYYPFESTEKIQNRLDLLTSCKILVKPIKQSNDWNQYYLKIFSNIKQEIKKR